MMECPAWCLWVKVLCPIPVISMKWILVVISLLNGPEVEVAGLYEDMLQCFNSRQQLIWDRFQDSNGQPPINFQVVCIPSDKYL